MKHRAERLRLGCLCVLVLVAGTRTAMAQAPSITGVSPASPTVSAAARTLTVTGANFQTGLTLTVTPPRFGLTALPQLQSVTSTSFQVTLVLAVVGTYTFQVQSPSGEKSNILS